MSTSEKIGDGQLRCFCTIAPKDSVDFIADEDGGADPGLWVRVQTGAIRASVLLNEEEAWELYKWLSREVRGRLSSRRGEFLKEKGKKNG